MLGIENLPIMVRDLSTTEADLQMVDRNKQRPNIKLSEYARSLQVKYTKVTNASGITYFTNLRPNDCSVQWKAFNKNQC